MAREMAAPRIVEAERREFEAERARESLALRYLSAVGWKSGSLASVAAFLAGVRGGAIPLSAEEVEAAASAA